MDFFENDYKEVEDVTDKKCGRIYGQGEERIQILTHGTILENKKNWGLKHSITCLFSPLSGNKNDKSRDEKSPGKTSLFCKRVFLKLLGKN